MNERVSVVHRRRVSAADVHYGGELVAGALMMELIGDAATELCVRTDGDEGLLAGYSSVEFVRPVAAGDFLEVRGEVTRMGDTSRDMVFEVFVYARRRPDVSDSAADLLDEPELVGRATGTCVVPPGRRRPPRGE